MRHVAEPSAEAVSQQYSEPIVRYVAEPSAEAVRQQYSEPIVSITTSKTFRLKLKILTLKNLKVIKNIK